MLSVLFTKLIRRYKEKKIGEEGGENTNGKKGE